MPKTPLLADKHPFFQMLGFTGLAFTGLVLSAILGGVLASAIYGVNIITPGWMDDLSDPKKLDAIKLVQLVNATGFFILPPLIFARLMSNNGLEWLGMRSNTSAPSLITAALFMACALPVINWMAEWNNNLSLPESMKAIEAVFRAMEDQAARLTEALIEMDSVGDYLYIMLIVAVIPGIGEELLFRGVLQRVLIKWTRNPHWGIWIAAILFSALHGQFFGFFPRMLMGAGLGYLFYWSGSLWMPIVAHFANNALAVTLAWLISSEQLDKAVETVGADEGTQTFMWFSLMITMGWLYIIFIREKKRRGVFR